MVLMLALSQWSLCEFTHILFTDLDMILFWSKFSYFGIVIAPVAWFDFAVNYTGRKKYFNNRWRIPLLMIIPVITLVLVFTNQYHSLIWENITLIQKNSIFYYVKDYGPWFYVTVAYSYLLMMVGAFYIIDPLSMSFSLYKRQKTFLILGILIPLIANAIYVSFGPPIYSLDTTPLTFLASSSIMLYSLFHLGFLDIIPIAQKNILESIKDSILVLDYSKRIVHINDSAASLIGARASGVVGNSIDEVMPNWKKLMGHMGDEMSDVEEQNILENMNKKYYNCTISPLMQNDKNLGHLIIIRDVTLYISNENRIKKLNEHLKLINKMLRHDISNHLTVASFSIEMLNTNDIEMKRRAQRSISRSFDIIKRMKELENVISKHQELKGYKMSDVFKDIIKNYPEIEFNMEGDCNVLADDAISSVLDNLVNNAIVHGSTDRIDVNMITKDGSCIIDIKDYGIGIPDSIKEDIFKDEFSYGDNKGTGIGLFIVKKSIERYGGEIKVSDNEPRGTVFTLILKEN